MAMSWWKFATPSDYKGIPGFINGFAVKRLHASRDEAAIAIEVGHFAEDPETGYATDMVSQISESVRLTAAELLPHWSVVPDGTVPVGMLVFGMCYQLVVAQKEAELAAVDSEGVPLASAASLPVRSWLGEFHVL